MEEELTTTKVEPSMTESGTKIAKMVLVFILIPTGRNMKAIG
jgi:hypothetical protein